MLGMIIMGIGATGIMVSVAFEIKTKEPIYALMMKIFPLVFAVGVAIWALEG